VLSGKGLLCDASWPKADPALTRDDSVTVAVQVNGKLRATIELPRDCDNRLAEAQALGDERIRRLLDGKPPRKVIVVPNRIVNVVL
jgi:leucyl-tRNA synthetase